MAQVTEHLPSKHEALNSNPGITKHSSNKQKEKWKTSTQKVILKRKSGCLLLPPPACWGWGRMFLSLFLFLLALLHFIK
jgi:hypothetical protein